ncbi:hypothetical protein EIN_340320 [Entamoeba invadens IP1]|uniref:Maltose O-acetyltransferase n=1 Tax=Entamoeba invadens IP1 TaxID=370355 RepID=A0A0A1UDP4_ENTIV|nr:hypothetical protein EIN_340320 [Entamoeba invadens IP1]ELP94714.1 hypothetical protein EIN_340320 [Entamoeba invadens IP1]|eukprot:XP_004261485.1 hypothetical protein EIN_340320 [Entamoeba invadens IP1]
MTETHPNECDYMRQCKLYDTSAPYLLEDMYSCNKKTMTFNSTIDSERRVEILKTILKQCGENVTFIPPFYCDYGKYIEIGDYTTAGPNFTILDGNIVTIGKHVIIESNVTIMATSHPTDPMIRKAYYLYSLPIVVNDNVLIESNSVILPGIVIGKNSVIKAGSVVTKNVPENTIVEGNPAIEVGKIRIE